MVSRLWGLLKQGEVVRWEGVDKGRRGASVRHVSQVPRLHILFCCGRVARVFFLVAGSWTNGLWRGFDGIELSFFTTLVLVSW